MVAILREADGSSVADTAEKHTLSEQRSSAPGASTLVRPIEE
jgi:hypothetical protein